MSTEVDSPVIIEKQSPPSPSQSKIKVVMLITDLITAGAQRALFRLLTKIDRERYTPIVVALYNGDSPFATEIRKLDIEVVDLNLSPRYRLDRLWGLVQVLRRERPQILHAWMIHANIVGRLIGRFARVPIVIISRRTDFLGSELRVKINRALAGWADATITVSEHTRQVELRETGQNPEHVIAIPNGIDQTQFRERVPVDRAEMRASLGYGASDLVVGAIGRLDPQKGFDHLLNAMAQLKPRLPQVKLVIFGKGKLDAALKAQVEALGLSEEVKFGGVRTDILDVMQAFDIFALPSNWEGMPNVLLEAMASGVPSVTTAVGAMKEIVTDGETGLLVPPGDPEALANALLQLAREPDLRHKLGAAGREHIFNHYTLEQVVEKTQALYEMWIAKKWN